MPPTLDPTPDGAPQGRSAPWAAPRGLNLRGLSFAGRLGLVGAAVGVAGLGVAGAWGQTQSNKPLAKRWYLFGARSYVPVTFVERRPDPSDPDSVILRFALPEPHDYAGYDPVSSVLLSAPRERFGVRIKRYYTPISHPEQRGWIEFAVRLRRPGLMCERMRYFKPGDVCFLGPWMKEFSYRQPLRSAAEDAGAEAGAGAGAPRAWGDREEFGGSEAGPSGGAAVRTSPADLAAAARDPSLPGDIGAIVSSGASSIALQLLNVITSNPSDATRLDVLLCASHPAKLPHLALFKEFMARRPGQFRVGFCVQHVPVAHEREGAAAVASAAAVGTEYSGYVGMIDPLVVAGTMPPPVVEETVAVEVRAAVTEPAAAGAAGASPPPPPPPSVASHTFTATRRPPILVSGPAALHGVVSGHVLPVWGQRYVEGGPLRYHGVLKGMGYSRRQVYKFGGGFASLY